VTREDAAVQPTAEAAVGSRPVPLDNAAVWWWGPVALYASAILVGASVPPSSIPGDVSDSSLHVWGYAGFTAILVRAFARGRWTGVSAAHAAVSASIATMYGFAMEVYQLFVPGRYFDLRDVLADAVGGFGAGVVVLCGGRALAFVLRRHSKSS
jgi:VanZ family protein